MKRVAAIVVGFLFGLGIALPCFAQSAIDQLFPVPNFPFPDPAVTSQNLWMTQNGVDYRVNITQLGYILQQNCNIIQSPFVDQLCWDNTVTPNVLKAFQGGTWVTFPALSGFAPLNSPAFTGIPTAPTAPPGTNTAQIATTDFVTDAIRKQASSDITLYVAATGNDLNNDCTVQANPCLNIQTAVDLIYNTYDMHGNHPTISIADGTYALSSVSTIGSGLDVSSTTLTIQGNPGTPDNVSLLCSASCFIAGAGSHINIVGMKLTSTQDGIWAHSFAAVNFAAIDFSTAGLFHILASEGAIVQATGNYTISAGAQVHWRARDGGKIFGFIVQQPGPSPFPTIVVNLLNTPAFSVAFAHASQLALIRCDSDIFTGTGANGVRYNVSGVSQIFTAGAGSTFLPGNLAGTADATSFGSYF